MLSSASPPLAPLRYSTLYRLIPGSSAASVAQRLLLDQLAFAPAFIPLFMVSLLTLEGESENEMSGRITAQTGMQRGRNRIGCLYALGAVAIHSSLLIWKVIREGT
jgi:hypothetical protein